MRLLSSAVLLIWQVSYTYSYEFVKDPGSDTMYVMCDACPSASRPALKPKDIQIAIKVVVPEPNDTSPGAPISIAAKDGMIREKDILPEPPGRQLFSTIYFDFGSSSYKEDEEKKMVDTIASLREMKNRKVKVSGYTCSIGTQEYNDRLALDRANTVAKRLEANGIRVSEVAGEGKCCYISKNNDLNRRVEITVEK